MGGGGVEQEASKSVQARSATALESSENFQKFIKKWCTFEKFSKQFNHGDMRFYITFPLKGTLSRILFSDAGWF